MSKTNVMKVNVRCRLTRTALDGMTTTLYVSQQVAKLTGQMYLRVFALPVGLLPPWQQAHKRSKGGGK